MPDDLTPVENLDEFFEIVGLSSSDVFFILSSGLRKTKEWVLRRILSSDWAASRHKDLQEEAKSMLQIMMGPVKSKDLEDDEDEEPSEILKKYNYDKHRYSDDEEHMVATGTAE
jgi:hypothetical protein